MKIELNLTADQVFAVEKLLNQVYDLFPSVDCEQLAVRSIAFDLAEQFTAKRKALIKKNSLFDVNKKYKMSLKYHEAVALRKIIGNLIETVNDIKSTNDLRMLYHFLHKETT
jgi:hypothetical protein